MRKANELIGKSIVHQASGERLGSVRDLVFEPDASKVAAILVDGGNLFREARVINWGAVASIGDVVMVTGDAPVQRASDAPEVSDELRQDAQISGTAIVSETGERIGTVGDLFIDDAGSVIGYEIKQGFVSDLGGRKFLSVAQVKTVGKDAIIADVSDLPTVKQAQRDENERTA
jgi:uncharacterized protein YrrD